MNNLRRKSKNQTWKNKFKDILPESLAEEETFNLQAEPEDEPEAEPEGAGKEEKDQIDNLLKRRGAETRQSINDQIHRIYCPKGLEKNPVVSFTINALTSVVLKLKHVERKTNQSGSSNNEFSQLLTQYQNLVKMLETITGRKPGMQKAWVSPYSKMSDKELDEKEKEYLQILGKKICPYPGCVCPKDQELNITDET